MADPKTHDLNLTIGAAVALKQIMLMPEWATKPSLLLGAAEIEEHPAIDGLDIDGLDEQIARDGKTILARDCVLNGISERARDACKAAVRHAISKGRINGTRYARVLITELGIED